MSIRLLAIEVYSAMKRVKSLEEEFKALSLEDPAREEVTFRLAREKAELTRIKRLLDGAKS